MFNDHGRNWTPSEKNFLAPSFLAQKCGSSPKKYVVTTIDTPGGTPYNTYVRSDFL